MLVAHKHDLVTGLCLHLRIEGDLHLEGLRQVGDKRVCTRQHAAGIHERHERRLAPFLAHNPGDLAGHRVVGARMRALDEGLRVHGLERDVGLNAHEGTALVVHHKRHDAVGVLESALSQGPLDVLPRPAFEARRKAARLKGMQVPALERQGALVQAPAHGNDGLARNQVLGDEFAHCRSFLLSRR